MFGVSLGNLPQLRRMSRDQCLCGRRVNFPRRGVGRRCKSQEIIRVFPGVTQQIAANRGKSQERIRIFGAPHEPWNFILA